MNINLSKKQEMLLKLITEPNIKEIYTVGSTQSGKTYVICLSVILYAERLYKENSKEKYNGAIIGWTTETLKGNVVDVMEEFLKGLNIPYELKYGQNEKYIKIYNCKFYFYGFNNNLSFNKILGKPLIFIWCDESARIYTQNQLRDSFDELPGRQMRYAGHPYLKTIHSFNVEGNENHPYKKKYLEKSNVEYITFLPYDNPKITTKEQIKEILNMFPSKTLIEQKIFCKWVISEGLVFDKYNIITNVNNFILREIGLGIDYGSENPTCFIPIALAYNNETRKWGLIRLECYYHNSKELNTKPTTEYFSKQLRLFIEYLKNKYKVNITENVIDSEATHFGNRLETDGIKYKKSIKGAGSVREGVQYLQSLLFKEYFYILKENSITHINDNGNMNKSNKDESLLEFQSYKYDTNTSIKQGFDCFKKENDHSIDSVRYLLQEWRLQNKAPTV